MPVFGGNPAAPVATQWTALASFLAAATARSCTVTINWWQASGAASAVRASDTSVAVTDSTSGWTQAAVTANSPSDALYASVTVNVAGCAASEVHYVDEISFAPQGSTIWTRGGLAGTGVLILERTIDGGVTWVAVRGSNVTLPTPSQSYATYDYEAAPLATAGYRARVQDIV